jgi:hypothetical protein
MAFTMACPNFKKGLKMVSGPLGVNIQRKIRKNQMEFSQSIFSYCDYVVILDVEVHGYHMDIRVVSQGYHKVLQDIKCFKLQ